MSKGCAALIDKNRIILMSKLALYEKRHMKEDKKRTSYFREDYIYSKNFMTRICVTICIFMFAGVNVLNKINNGENIPLLDYYELFNSYIVPYSSLLVVSLFIYTLVSTVIYGRKYDLSQKRIQFYKEQLKKLDECDKHKLSN